LAARFLDRATVEGLSADCVDSIRRPRFDVD